MHDVLRLSNAHFLGDGRCRGDVLVVTNQSNITELYALNAFVVGTNNTTDHKLKGGLLKRKPASYIEALQRNPSDEKRTKP